MTRWFRQNAVVWKFAAYDSAGEATVYSPELLEVRWERVKRSVVGRDGTSIAVDVEMWTKANEDEIPLHSIVAKQTLDEIPGTATDLFQVVDYDDIPDVKGSKQDRVYYLSVFHDTLPTVVA